MVCVNNVSAEYPLTIYRYFRDEIGAEFIQFIPIVERINNNGYQKGAKISRRSVLGKEHGRFLKTIFDEWIRSDVGKVFVQIFDHSLKVYLGYPAGGCVFASSCGSALALEHNGICILATIMLNLIFY